MNKKKELSTKVWVPTPEEIEEQRQWILKEIERIGLKKILHLAKTAAVARQNAYQPYSNYSVGATILTINEKVFSSCNAEVVTYTETDHAEQSAITQAISRGAANKRRNFIQAIAVSHSEKSGPCGGCRQRIAEHADNCLIVDVGTSGNIKKITSLDILFPYSFRPSHLDK